MTRNVDTNSLSVHSRPLPASSQSDEFDNDLVALWLGTKVSAHTRRAYRAEIERFRAATGKPLALVTMADLQAYAALLGQGTLKPASQNRALTAIKSLLSFGHETGGLPFNVGAAVKLRPNRDGLAVRATGFNVFSYGLCMKGTVKETLGYINQPIVIGGIAVRPGDIVSADDDGVKFVAHGR